MLLAGGACDCSDQQSLASQQQVGEPPPSRDAAEELFVEPAIRCGECHGAMEAGWRASAHGRSNRSPAYRAMREEAGVAMCAGCHEPLAGRVDARKPGANEGVTCDVCHAISEVDAKLDRSDYTLRLDDNTKYGPLCDAKDHYFHKMGCAPLFEDGDYCAACHQWRRELPSGEMLPIYTEYQEWREGPYGDAGMDCQQCHMPNSRGEVAKGAGERTGVSHHGFLGDDGELRRRAVSVRVDAVGEHRRVEVEVVLRNTGAGHMVPTGTPGRRLVLELRSLDGNGGQVDRASRSYARVLVDAAGDEVPFYRAVRVESDNRIAPRGEAKERFELAAAPTHELEIKLYWLARSPELAAALELEPPEGELVLEQRVSLGKAFTAQGKAPIFVHEVE